MGETMRLLPVLAAFAAALPIGGCATTQSDRVQAIKSSSIQSVVDDMKRQVSVYVAYQNSPQGTRSVVDASATKACGNGLIDFDIKSVKLEILTTLESSVDGGVEVGPIVSGAAAWSGGLGAGRTISNTQELVLAVDALPNRSFVYARSEDVKSAPIAATLINLREALIKAGEVPNRICFKTAKDADDGNTYKIALSIEDRGGGNVSLGVAPLGVSLSGETKSTTGNTLTVSFEPHMFTQQEVANAGGHGRRGKIDARQGNIWSTPVKPSKQAGSGNNCPPGSIDPACQGTFNRKEPEI